MPRDTPVELEEKLLCFLSEADERLRPFVSEYVDMRSLHTLVYRFKRTVMYTH